MRYFFQIFQEGVSLHVSLVNQESKSSSSWVTKGGVSTTLVMFVILLPENVTTLE